MQVRAKKAQPRSIKLDPFKNVSRETCINHRAGKIIVTYWKALGMLSTGNTKPDNNCDGNIPDIIAICMATICLRVVTEIKSPWAR